MVCSFLFRSQIEYITVRHTNCLFINSLVLANWISIFIYYCTQFSDEFSWIKIAMKATTFPTTCGSRNRIYNKLNIFQRLFIIFFYILIYNKLRSKCRIRTLKANSIFKWKNPHSAIPFCGWFKWYMYFSIW